MNRRYRSLLWQWTRQLWRRPLPVTIEERVSVAPRQVAITRGGHATTLIRYHNLTILTDPLLDRFCKGVARVEACGISTAMLADVDLVLISNLAADHLHRPSLARLAEATTVVVPRGGARELGGLGFDRVLELRPGQAFNHAGVDIVTAAGSPRSLLYVLRGHGPSILFCGASGPTDSFAQLGVEYQPDVALLPIGGYTPKSFRRRHLTPVTALDAFEALRARVFIPHRYGTFALSYETLEDPERWLGREVSRRGLERYVEILRTGETQLLVPPRGRARTEHGQARRPIGRHGDEDHEDEDEDSLEIDVDVGDDDSHTSNDTADRASGGIDGDINPHDEAHDGAAAAGDESLQRS